MWAPAPGIVPGKQRPKVFSSLAGCLLTLLFFQGYFWFDSAPPAPKRACRQAKGILRAGPEVQARRALPPGPARRARDTGAGRRQAARAGTAAARTNHTHTPGLPTQHPRNLVRQGRAEHGMGRGWQDGPLRSITLRQKTPSPRAALRRADTGPSGTGGGERAHASPACATPAPQVSGRRRGRGRQVELARACQAQRAGRARAGWIRASYAAGWPAAS